MGFFILSFFGNAFLCSGFLLTLYVNLIKYFRYTDINYTGSF